MAILCCLLAAACSAYIPPPQSASPAYLNERQPRDVLATFPAGRLSRSAMLDVNGPPNQAPHPVTKERDRELWTYVAVTRESAFTVDWHHYVAELRDGIVADLTYYGLGPCNGLRASRVQANGGHC